MEMVIICFLLTVVFSTLFLISLNQEKDRKLKEKMEYHAKTGGKKEEKAAKEKKGLKFLFKDGFHPLKNRLREYYNNTTPSAKEDEIQRKLLNAGSPFRMTVADYYIINNIMRMVMPMFFIAYGIMLKLSVINVFFMALIGFALSFKTLDYYILIKTRERHRKALRELPDFLDILTISVEAGMGFDLALTKTIENRGGIIPLEFSICLEEMRLGKIRREALLGVKERLAFDEMISFINSIIQSEKLGTGIVNTLRTKSEDERDKRKQRAEEEAMKTSIKILLPLIFFIFPSILIITLGPAAYQIMKNLGGMK